MSSRGKGRGQYRGRGYARGRFRGRGRSGYGRGHSYAWNHHSAHAPYVSVPLSTKAMPIHPMATQGLYGHTGFPPMSMHHFGMQSTQPQLQVQHPGAPTPIQWINQDGTHAPPSSVQQGNTADRSVGGEDREGGHAPADPRAAERSGSLEQPGTLACIP